MNQAKLFITMDTQVITMGFNLVFVAEFPPKMGANTLLKSPSVEEECGGAIFSEVLSRWFRYCQLFSVRYSHVDSDVVSYLQRCVLILVQRSFFTGVKYFHFSGAIFGKVYFHSGSEYLLCTDVAVAVPRLKINLTKSINGLQCTVDCVTCKKNMTNQKY